MCMMTVDVWWSSFFFSKNVYYNSVFFGAVTLHNAFFIEFASHLLNGIFVFVLTTPKRKKIIIFLYAICDIECLRIELLEEEFDLKIKHFLIRLSPELWIIN